MARDEVYRQAEEKIEEALLLGQSELDLSGAWAELDNAPKLTELPESLSQLTLLEKLNISRNRLDSLPDWLANFRRLQSLDISENQLTSLPKWLGQLTRLKALKLSSNQLSALPMWLGGLAQLETLFLSDCRLEAVPDFVGQLAKLVSLDLSRNRLAALPGSLRRLAQLQSLRLDFNHLEALPEWLCQLTELHSLTLSHNQLNTLPEWVGELTQLRELELSGNRLSTLPESFGRLTRLLRLNLNKNPLRVLPECVGQLECLEDLPIGGTGLTDLPQSLEALKPLRRLYLWDNPLTKLPPWLHTLTELEVLNLRSTQISELPEQVGDLQNLTHLFAEENNLVDLPISITTLEKLAVLELDKNPLNPELATAYGQGLDAVKRYLRELAKGTRRRYEAKLLILGDGNEGKTCVSRAIRGLPFQPQVTTRGVDVEQWKFEHPDNPGDDDKEITLNIWDFEGQEINHQTHQFFLTTQALYLVVFKCRDQFPMDRAEYWLDTIRARAPQAKVAIVISESEKRTPYVPQDRLQAEYGDLLAGEKWLFAVGCEDDSGIVELQYSLERCAADLELMGREWPESYSRAEEAIKDKAREDIPHISRGQLYDIFKGSSIDDSIFNDLAESMTTLGVMTQFPDCPDLRDFIVLHPQWLTKAISEIMEDRQLASDKGEIALQRMESIWEDKGYSGMFATFHDCMKEFELCYDLEDATRSCCCRCALAMRSHRYPGPTVRR